MKKLGSRNKVNRKAKSFSIAIAQLKHEKIRFLVALSGIIFAVVMMFMQLGFRDALFDSSILLHRSMQGDLFLLHPKSSALLAVKSFSKYYLYQLQEFKEVQSVSPVRLGYATWKNPWNFDTRAIFVIGVDPSNNLLELPGLEKNLNKIIYPDTVLFDEASRTEFGPVVEKFRSGEKVISELQGPLLQEPVNVSVSGLFKLGTSFSANGHLLTSSSNFIHILTNRDNDSIEIGIIKLKAETDANQVAKAMRTKLPDDVKVFTKQEFMDVEKNYWQSSTAIGFIFSLSTTMAFFVGTVIVYQVLYTDVAEHLPSYAVLKAIGYRDFSLLGIILQEALILSVLGYIPGLLIAMISYQQTKTATLLPIGMTVDRASNLFFLTVVMCVVSGLIAVRKLRQADPADIF